VKDLKERIEAKIKQIEEDIKSISRGEMLGVYNGKSHPKEQEIKFQQWRIDILKHIKTMKKDQVANELIRLQEQYKKESKYETLVVMDLYRLYLGVI
jgi:uncharacterized protein (UPF0335 family)